MQDIALAVLFMVYSMYLLIIKCNLTKPKQKLLDYANWSRMWPHIRIVYIRIKLILSFLQSVHLSLIKLI